jgi:DNA-binding MarR family transcriptional regulator
VSRARPIDRHEPGEDGLLPAEREVQEALGHLSLDFRAMRAISNLFRTSAAIRRHMEARVLGPYRLSWTSFVGLWVLWVWGEMEARGFAEAVGISRPTATGVMTTLESRGYVTRRKDASDGRMVIVALTPAGRSTIEELFPKFNAEESALAAHLEPQQQDDLAAMLRALLRAVTPSEREHRGPVA